MPYFDGTGPMGMGPMTGRGFGPCGTGMGRGFGRGMGFGRRQMAGMGWFNGPQFITQKDQLEMLEEYRQSLEDELESIKAQIAEIQKDK